MCETMQGFVVLASPPHVRFLRGCIKLLVIVAAAAFCPPQSAQDFPAAAALHRAYRCALTDCSPRAIGDRLRRPQQQ